MSKEKSDGVKLLKNSLTVAIVIGLVLTIVFILLSELTINFNVLVEYSLYIQIAVVLIFLFPVYFWIYKAKQYFSQIDETADADDPHRVKADKMLFRGLLFNRLFYILSYVSFGIGFDFENPYFLMSMLIFGVTIFPGSLNEVKIIRMIQANDPMKKGDPTSFKFNSDYFSSLDEGEKIQVYQATYHTFKFMEYTLLFGLGLSFFLKLLYDLGNGPMLIVGLIWLIQSIAYFYYLKKFSKSQTWFYVK